MTSTTDVLVIGGGATGAGVLRDLARRGLRGLLVERGDPGSGTSGRYHGLLHSGARYVVSDPLAARECAVENEILRRIAPRTIEDTRGWYVQAPGDPDAYTAGFAAACAAAGVPCEERPVGEVLAHEPALDPDLQRAFAVRDAALEPWELIEANLADAIAHGAEVRRYTSVVAVERAGRRILSVTLADERSGSTGRVVPRLVVSAAGAWAGRVAALAGVRLQILPGRGTMLVFAERLSDAVINRCHPPGDGDLMVPVHTVSILGTTDVQVSDPDDTTVERAEVAALLDEGERLFPALRERRLLRAYAGVRPLYEPPAEDDDGAGDGASPGGRMIRRSHVVIDHAARDGVDDLVSIVGGKLTTYRLMAEQTVDLVMRKLGTSARCTTADEALPGQEPARHHWLGARLAAHEAAGGGDADLICECELVTRPELDAFLDTRWPCSLDDVRRGTRLGMGPCQGGFCTFRAAGVLADREARRGASPEAVAGLAATAAEAFLEERLKGLRAVAWGRQLQEALLTDGLYHGVLGLPRSPAVDTSPETPDAVG
ncbi:MAG TPA: anaerobic glycerol-3-phosphate dehydrogenase subunit GlpA [Candidatus Sulfotelmatobacter sp.]|nr:anaerobic glycerol-3-phosphate dehydrogenase subunit GlpA [Candidatus Sulfotelmatobacter sp.]